jgi:hypothetical protein
MWGYGFAAVLVALFNLVLALAFIAGVCLIVRAVFL